MSTAEAFCVSRTMQAMEVLAFQPASAPQVAGALKVHPRTARRLLNRLVADGWVTRSDGHLKTYAPTMRIVALAAHLAERTPLAVAARAPVDRLHEDTGFVAHLAIPSYRSALCLVHRAGSVDARPQLRELTPAHATAAGKILLAYRPAWCDSVLELPLERLTGSTLADAQAVQSEVASIRERGFAREDHELAPGWLGVAVPVGDRHSAAAGALALTAAAEETTPGALDALVPRLLADAATIRDTLLEDSRA